MVLKKQKISSFTLSTRPPYPVLEENNPSQVNPSEPDSCSLLRPPASDSQDLEQVWRMPCEESTGPVIPEPESLKVGASSGEQGRRLSLEMRESFENSNVPDTLRPGASITDEAVRRSSEAERKDESFIHGAPSGRGNTHESFANSVTVDQERELRRKRSEVLEGKEVAGEQTPKSDASSPAPQMSATLPSADRPFARFGPLDCPLDSPFSDASPDPLIPSQQVPKRPTIITTISSSSENPQRHPSVAESTTSFHPGTDLSSFDASIACAYPCQRGQSTLDMGGWTENIVEVPVTKTWEEELEQRAKAGAELQRRTEETAKREREERLQAEFWEEERREQEKVLGVRSEITGPPKPPKSPKSASIEKPAETTPRPDSSSNTRPVPPPPTTLRVSPPQPSADTTTAIYQIKHINWIDPSRPGSALRRSPILLQNANGPCPLLALVNALVLSTPEGVKTSLVEVLRLREQVSLELLLDAVFEELMSRGSGGLPDVGDLFAFLLTLHTGMNVNPRFLPLDDERRASGPSGGFENTREMALYGAFKVPLVHGWLPEPTDLVLDAMRRRGAGSYEEAQTLLLIEEEIITKVTSGTQSELTSEEERICGDAQIIREFMEKSKTQLTAHGLDVLRGDLKAGHVAILFRNDHFMTILGGGRIGGDLVGLVTDMGFAGHEEVVFERLADVQGRQNEFLSGDFRPVGGGSSDPGNSCSSSRRQAAPRQEIRSLLDDDEGWQTVGSRRSQNNSQSIAATIERVPPPPPPGPSSSGNQQDYDYDTDLALAMQLQEEEDEMHRRHQRRTRNSTPAIPAVSSSHPAVPQRMSTPIPPPRPQPAPFQTHRPVSGSEEAPPPYEYTPSTPAAAAIPTPQLSPYQQQTRNSGISASPAVGSNPVSVARRGEQARGMLQEISGRSGGLPPARRSSVGATATASESSGRRECIIC
ncbi:unnamed protein product [Tuber aestivum]|uniref:MINDY deubiquitinase domain-containing protein n=1 Tax=Tuber aestivum TaxID=59557 RepID=A0A292PMR5_9PEZI|nr:unnamed protein product [Tuber aestivum]